MFPLYADMLRTVVLPNFTVFGWLVFLAEAFIAASLLLGVVARLGGLVGFLISVNLLIGLAAVPHEWYWTYVMLGLLCLLFTLTAAGRYVGLDGVLRARARPGSLLARLT